MRKKRRSVFLFFPFETYRVVISEHNDFAVVEDEFFARYLLFKLCGLVVETDGPLPRALVVDHRALLRPEVDQHAARQPLVRARVEKLRRHSRLLPRVGVGVGVRLRLRLVVAHLVGGPPLPLSLWLGRRAPDELLEPRRRGPRLLALRLEPGDLQLRVRHRRVGHHVAAAAVRADRLLRGRGGGRGGRHGDGPPLLLLRQRGRLSGGRGGRRGRARERQRRLHRVLRARRRAVPRHHEQPPAHRPLALAPLAANHRRRRRHAAPLSLLRRNACRVVSRQRISEKNRKLALRPATRAASIFTLLIAP